MFLGIIGKVRNGVKGTPWKSSERLATLRAVARRETFDALCKKFLRKGEGWEALAARVGITSRALRILRERGAARPFPETVGLFADAFGVSRDRVENAMRASRAAGK